MELKTLDEKLEYITSKVQLVKLTIPSNFDEAKEQLKQNPNSNPSLNYDGNKDLQEFKKIMSSSEPLDKKLTEISKELEDYKNHPWYPLFSQTLDELNYKIILASNIGKEPKILNESALKLFGEDNHAYTPEKFAKAHYDMQKIDKTKDIKEYNEHDFIKEIKSSCDKIGYTIKISDLMASRVRHDPVKKQIVIKKGSTFSEKDIEKLLVHEVETHAYQAFNARQQPYINLALNGPKEDDTREVLAARSEKEKKVLSPNTIGTLAAGLAYHLPLSEVFPTVKGFINNEDKAAGISLRAKQGLINTAEPGSSLRNTSYYKRLEEVLNLPLEDIKLLFSGRFSVSSLAILKTLKDLKEPQMLPRYLK